MNEHDRAAALGGASARTAGDEDPHAVQAGAAAVLLGMAVWRLEAALAADAEAARTLAQRVSERLAAPELGPAKAALRGLLLLLDPATAPPTAHAGASDGDDFALVRQLIEQSGRMLTAEPLERGAWAILRLLPDAHDGRASVADLAGLHGVPGDLVRTALRQLEAEGCIVVEPPADPQDDAAMARLTERGARQAGADPLPAFAQLLEEAFDAEGLWNLVQLGAALLQADRAELDASAARANGGEEHATTPGSEQHAARPRASKI